MAVVGTDLRAIVRAAVRCKDVRKLGFLQTELSPTPITTIQDDWTVNIETGEIADEKHFGRRWTQVVVSEQDVFNFLASTYGISSPGEQPPAKAKTELPPLPGVLDSGEDVARKLTLPAKRRGPKPQARNAVRERMLAALSAGDITPEQLKRDTEESLVVVYGGGHGRDTCRQARAEALSQFASE